MDIAVNREYKEPKAIVERSMKTLWRQSRRGTQQAMERRSRIPKRFLGALAGLAIAAAVDRLWNGFIPDLSTLRPALFLLGGLLLIDIIKIFRQR